MLYAVKCNPTEAVVKTLIKNGIKNFDAASIDEIKLVKKLSPNSKIYFMHTVKKESSIREAYFSYGVKAYSYDSKEELEKIPNYIEDNSNEKEATKNLCVHELRRRLKNKQRKENIIKVMIFFTLMVLIGVISLFFY